jgi:hypothetical protein
MVHKQIFWKQSKYLIRTKLRIRVRKNLLNRVSINRQRRAANYRGTQKSYSSTVKACRTKSNKKRTLLNNCSVWVSSRIILISTCSQSTRFIIRLARNRVALPLVSVSLRLSESAGISCRVLQPRVHQK